MKKGSRKKYLREVVAVEDALTLSRNYNVAGLSSAITLANELRTDYSAHVADQGASAGEHKALHTAGQLAAASVAAYNLTTLLALTNDLTVKYTLHDTDAAATTPTYHIADVGTGNALEAVTTVTTLSGAITRLNDIKTKYNLHQADATGHRTGNLYPIAATDSALGVAVAITKAEVPDMEGVETGMSCSWAILNDGAGNVTGVSAVPGDGKVTFTFSADPQDDAIISFAVYS